MRGKNRKQRFKKPELTNQVVQMVSAERALDLKIKTKIVLLSNLNLSLR